MTVHFTFLRRSLAGVLVLVTVLSACSVDADRQRIEVGLSTFGVALSMNSVTSGKITFVVKNNATDQTHELLVAQTDYPHDQIPVEAGATEFSEDSLTIIGEVEDIDSGAIKRLTLNSP